MVYDVIFVGNGLYLVHFYVAPYTYYLGWDAWFTSTSESHARRLTQKEILEHSRLINATLRWPEGHEP